MIAGLFAMHCAACWLAFSRGRGRSSPVYSAGRRKVSARRRVTSSPSAERRAPVFLSYFMQLKSSIRQLLRY